MIRLFKHYIPVSVLALGAAEFLILLLSSHAGVNVRLAMIGNAPTGFAEMAFEHFTFAAVISVCLLALGGYQNETCRDLRTTLVRVTASFSLAFLILSVVFFLFPDISLWRSVFAISFLIAFAGIGFARILFQRLVDQRVFKRHVLVLGAGPQAAQILELQNNANGTGFSIVGFLRMGAPETAIPDATPFAEIGALKDYVEQNMVDEIVVAAEERRGNLPYEQLLAAKISGSEITSFLSFMERETGQVDLDSLQPSWLIFSDGFTAGHRFDQVAKRIFDILASLLLLLFSAPILILATLSVWLTSPGPIFYRQERVGQFGRVYTLFKFRSMRIDAEKDGVPQWAAVKDPRITLPGSFMRATRIDEIPQIINVLIGDMSFVGPRPERPFFVDELKKDIRFYDERHQLKPGITGWAQINYPYGASVADAKRKLQYDLYYVKNYSIFLDLLILVQTARVILWPKGFAR